MEGAWKFERCLRVYDFWACSRIWAVRYLWVCDEGNVVVVCLGAVLGGRVRGLDGVKSVSSYRLWSICPSLLRILLCLSSLHIEGEVSNFVIAICSDVMQVQRRDYGAHNHVWYTTGGCHRPGIDFVCEGTKDELSSTLSNHYRLHSDFSWISIWQYCITLQQTQINPWKSTWKV